MDDILQFLLIAGIIVIGIVKQFKKEAKKNADNSPLCPCRTLTLTMTHCPFPKAGERLMADISPKVPNRNRNPFPQLKKNTNSLLQNIFFGGDPANTSPKPITAPPKQKISPPPSVQQKPETDSEYAIHSAEEARKAIIWSEILQRKY